MRLRLLLPVLAVAACTEPLTPTKVGTLSYSSITYDIVSVGDRWQVRGDGRTVFCRANTEKDCYWSLAGRSVDTGFAHTLTIEVDQAGKLPEKKMAFRKMVLILERRSVFRPSVVNLSPIACAVPDRLSLSDQHPHARTRCVAQGFPLVSPQNAIQLGDEP